MSKNFKDLSESEILALAISLEEEDGRIYGEFAEGLRETYPVTAKLLREMQSEESGHRASLIELYRARFGEHIPLIRRQDVKGFVSRPAVWPFSPSGLKPCAQLSSRRVGNTAFLRFRDAPDDRCFHRKLLGDLAEAEAKHSASA